MSGRRLNQHLIDALRPGRSVRGIRDTELRGFGIRILPSGRRRLFVHAQRDVRCRWTTVRDAGTMPLAEARALPRLRLAAMASGVTSPPEDASAETPFEDAAFRRHARLWKPGTLAVNRSYLMNHILPRFRGHPIAAITGADARQWFASLRTTPAAAAANRSMPVLSAVMR